MRRLRAFALAVVLSLGGLGTTVVPIVATAAPAAASHGGEVDCWTVDYFNHNEWFYDNASFYPYNYYGWWRNVRVDRYEQCANGAWYYEGQYSQGWYRCYCQPYWYDQGNDVYY